MDPFNYLRQVHARVLVLVGTIDAAYTLETSIQPMFKGLGPPPVNKKLMVYDGGHLVPRSEFIKESLLWLDEHTEGCGEEQGPF